MKVRVLEKRHPDYDPECWHQYDLMYRGGRDLKAAVDLFLVQNTAEHASWFAERKKRFTCKNVAGTIVDDYDATCLQDTLDLRLKKEEGKEREIPDAFYTDELFVDPTAEGMDENINDLAFKTLTGAMVKKRSWIMLTMPEQIPGFVAANLAEQEAAGQNRVILRKIAPENVVNWSHDPKGLASVITRYYNRSQSSPSRK